MSLETSFKEAEFGHEINLDIQAYTKRDNMSVNYNKLLKQSSRVARGKRVLLITLINIFCVLITRTVKRKGGNKTKKYHLNDLFFQLHSVKIRMVKSYML